VSKDDIPIGEVRFKCPNCGSAILSLPDNATDSSLIACNECGETLGTVAEARNEAVRAGKAAMPDIAREIRKALKGIKDFKSR
jgi:predicted RNA-binding Zn-ribbon protein involved in translation (DUF1610 family)